MFIQLLIILMLLVMLFLLQKMFVQSIKNQEFWKDSLEANECLIKLIDSLERRIRNLEHKFRDK